MKLDATVTGDFFARNTVKEVYEQIEKDLLEGNRLLSTYEYKRNFFRIDHLAAKAILSRMYLYMENWDKALAYADSVLMVKPDLFDMNSISLSRPNSSTASVYSTETPDETFGDGNTTVVLKCLVHPYRHSAFLRTWVACM